MAERAGVSPTAVSFVLNHKAEGRLGAETIERVRHAIRDLGYLPDGGARRAGWRRAAVPRTMGVGYLGADLDNSFHGAIIMAAAAEMRRAGYHLILACRLNTAAEAREHLRSLHGTAADGWLLTSIIEPEVIDFVAEERIPAVFVGSGTDVAGRVPQVRADDREGGRQATEHLLRLGHRRIAFAGAYPEAAFSRWRLDGYRAALQDAGLPPVEDDVFLGKTTNEVLAWAHRRVRNPQPPTALFVTGESMALELMRVLRAHGRAIPRDVSVVAFDDTPLALAADPPLTTVATPRVELGTLGFQLLQEELRQPGRARSIASAAGTTALGTPPTVARRGREERRRVCPQTVLPVELIVRGTTAPPRE